MPFGPPSNASDPRSFWKTSDHLHIFDNFSTNHPHPELFSAPVRSFVSSLPSRQVRSTQSASQIDTSALDEFLTSEASDTKMQQWRTNFRSKLETWSKQQPSELSDHHTVSRPVINGVPENSYAAINKDSMVSATDSRVLTKSRSAHNVYVSNTHEFMPEQLHTITENDVVPQPLESFWSKAVNNGQQTSRPSMYKRMMDPAVRIPERPTELPGKFHSQPLDFSELDSAVSTSTAAFPADYSYQYRNRDSVTTTATLRSPLRRTNTLPVSLTPNVYQAISVSVADPANTETANPPDRNVHELDELIKSLEPEEFQTDSSHILSAGSSKYINAQSPTAMLIREVSNFMNNQQNQNVGSIGSSTEFPTPTRSRFPLSGVMDLQEDHQLSRLPGRRPDFVRTFEHFDNLASTRRVHTSHPTSPGTSIDDHVSSVPLPHPQPKHHLLRDQVAFSTEMLLPFTAQNIVSRIGGRVSTGSVANRVQQFEDTNTPRTGPSPSTMYRALRPALTAHWSNIDVDDRASPSLDELLPMLDAACGEFSHMSTSFRLPSKDSQRSPRSPAWTEREQPILPSPCSPIPSTSASTIATPVITTAQSPLPYPPNYERTREHIPRFYFPRGRPSATNTTASTLMKIEHIFERLPNQRALRHDMPEIVQALGIPLYWKYPLFLACKDPSSSDEDGITLPQFKRAWQLICADCHDQAARFVRILTMHDAPAVDVQHAALREQHFVSLVQDICESHPGLSFLRDATEFHPRYVETVISRIFFSCQQPWLGRITVELLRRSNFLPTLERLEREEDINQITDYFSYEHFYVIYCKFWEIDRDHDCLIENVDLARHNGGAISTRVIERIFAPGSVIRHRRADNKMTYSDFVWFLMAEEDKRHPTSIEYWFRCLDVDGDGFLSYQELEHFYDEQCQSMEARGIDPIPFTDMLCQLIDMLAPRQGTCLSLSDLKRNASMTPAVLDTFVNVEKYLEMEQRDGVNALRVESEDGFSDWERFAAVEYEQLVEEEQANSTVAVVRSAGDGIVDSDKLSESLRSDSDEPVVPILIDHHQLLSE